MLTWTADMNGYPATPNPYTRCFISSFLVLIIGAMYSLTLAAAPPSVRLIELEQVVDPAAELPTPSAYLRKLLADPANQELRWVDAYPDGVAETTKSISFSVSEKKTVTFDLFRFKKSIAGMVVWIGESSSGRKLRYPSDSEVDFDPFNNAVIVRDGHKLMGTFTVDGQPYKLVFVHDGRHVLIKVDETRLALESEPRPVPREATASSHASTAASTTADLPTSFIRVMMVTTRQSRAAQPNLTAEIVNAIEAANLAMSNSDIPIIYQLADVYDADYDEAGTSGANLDQLVDAATDLGKAVAARRDLYLLDMVSMVITAPDTCGLAYLNANKAFSFSVVTCLTSLAHELGHNLGATHNWEEGDPVGSPPYMFGYRNETPPKFRTQMSYDCLTGSCPRVAWFSTPRKTYLGAPMGTVEHHDVARRFDERRGVFDDFYPGGNNGYTPYLNQYMLDAGRSLCMQTTSEHDFVRMAPCSASGTEADQNSMREWRAEPQGDYWIIKNLYKDLQGNGERCLMVPLISDMAQIGACSPAAGEYSSQRLWKLEHVSNEMYELKNKYRSDSEKGSCLRTSSQTMDVRVGPCFPDGDFDYFSMRRWNWEMFN